MISNGATAGAVSSVPPPSAVRAAFSLFLGEVVLSVVNAVVQLSFHLNGAVVLLGSAIEAVLFIGLGVRMRAGRAWARTALMSFAGVFAAFGVLTALAARAARDEQLSGLVLFALLCVGGKVLLMIAGTVMMYRPSTHGYFR